MMSRIRDGNDVRSPRNLIDLVSRTRSAAIRREEREKTEYAGRPILHQEAFKSGLRALSKDRVEDTLLAEAGERASLVERFRGGKAEHNDESLGQTLGMSGSELEQATEFLREIGFLEQTGVTVKVPMLYRDGLSITQGKAFDPEAAPEEEE